MAGGIQTLFGRAVLEPLKMIACLVLAAFICWQLLLLSLIVAPVAGFLIVFLAKTLKRANRKALEEMSSLYAILVETFSGIKVVKAFTMERHERRRFHVTSKKCYRKAMRIALFDGLINPVTEVMGISTICLAILFGAYLVMNRETHLLGIKMCSRPLSLSELLLFYGMLAGVSDPARRLTEVFNQLQRAAAAADRVYQLLDREPTVCDPPQPTPLPRHHRDLVFDRVSFRYRPQQPVLEEINLRIPFGETIAIVGPNGCGKSTLVNLIPRFFDPVSGSVRLDGVDLRDVRLRDLRSQIGLVTQETLLFDDTVLNNIRYGCPQATREQVIEAAKQAHAHKFIEQKLEARLRNHRRPGRRPALGRTAAADRPGPGHPARSGDPDPRRSHQPDRPGKRAADPQGAGAVHSPSHDGDRHPSPGHAGPGRPDRGDELGPDRRPGHPRPADGPLRPLPPAAPDSVQRDGLSELACLLSPSSAVVPNFLAASQDSGAPFALRRRSELEEAPLCGAGERPGPEQRRAQVSGPASRRGVATNDGNVNGIQELRAERNSEASS